MRLWVELFLPIELQLRLNEKIGKYSDKDWAKATGRNLMKCFDYSRFYNSAGSNACRPILIHPILMSIVFEYYKQLEKLRRSVVK
jgi:hypothetical protein